MVLRMFYDHFVTLYMYFYDRLITLGRLICRYGSLYLFKTSGIMFFILSYQLLVQSWFMCKTRQEGTKKRKLTMNTCHVPGTVSVGLHMSLNVPFSSL